MGKALNMLFQIIHVSLSHMEVQEAPSDYDVGLVGPKSGDLLANFNDKFEEMFGKSSEEVFDTNIYAYTLEYAIPSKFEGTASYLNLHYTCVFVGKIFLTLQSFFWFCLTKY